MSNHQQPEGGQRLTSSVEDKVKHMVGFTYNEVSRRYVDSDPEFFTPVVWRKRAEDKKQGSSDEEVTFLRYQGFKEQSVEDGYELFLEHAEDLYRDMLEAGVAPEQARMVLPQSMYTEYYVTGSLAAWARAYRQRFNSDSQKEIQEMAKEWGEIIRPLFPVSWKALTEDV